MSEGKLKITLRRSMIGCHAKRKRTLKALGLRRLGQTVVRPDNDSIRGMLKAVHDLVDVEPAQED
ncbi:MAG: 50S ribosomal protein L30 [Armatimonadetes bacterium]|nr:50S ribosomal protein L30 [Armatimonadota bacterium]